ncbi:unnamed protein product [Parnassius apollo]|uniref:(apollo) hypothetical protein n=1 Tax=Parnassius apollo TaxID=110799 RepID=A0A8S3XED0_PARAO|nr:unnamed protein product [Parnassius apollo]
MQFINIGSLFLGRKFLDTLRTSKLINKSGAELKVVTVQRVVAVQQEFKLESASSEPQADGASENEGAASTFNETTASTISRC